MYRYCIGCNVTVHMWVVVLFLALILVGCQAHVSSESPVTVGQSASNPTVHNATADQQIELVVNGISIHARRPPNWEYFETDFGVVLAEYIGSVATDGQLQGLLMHLHVPPLENVRIPVGSNNSNRAWVILDQVSHQPDTIGSAKVSEPVAFRWGGLDAAYYLMDSGEGSVTLIMGVIVPQSNGLVACSLSAPRDQAARIRQELPQLLDGLEVNDVVLDGDDLAFLPDPLEFPVSE